MFLYNDNNICRRPNLCALSIRWVIQRSKLGEIKYSNKWTIMITHAAEYNCKSVYACRMWKQKPSACAILFLFECIPWHDTRNESRKSGFIWSAWNGSCMRGSVLFKTRTEGLLCLEWRMPRALVFTSETRMTYFFLKWGFFGFFQTPKVREDISQRIF